MQKIDKTELEFFREELKEIEKAEKNKNEENKETVYKMSNKETAEAITEELKKEFPRIKKWEIGITQYITLGEQGEKKMKKRISNKIAKLKKIIREYEAIEKKLEETA